MMGFRKLQEQMQLFKAPSDVSEHWQDMPEYRHDDLFPVAQVVVNFDSVEAVREFETKLGLTKALPSQLTKRLQAIWYPEQPCTSVKHLVYRRANATGPNLHPDKRALEQLPDC